MTAVTYQFLNALIALQAAPAFAVTSEADPVVASREEGGTRLFVLCEVTCMRRERKSKFCDERITRARV